MFLKNSFKAAGLLYNEFHYRPQEKYIPAYVDVVNLASHAESSVSFYFYFLCYELTEVKMFTGITLAQS